MKDNKKKTLSKLGIEQNFCKPIICIPKNLPLNIKAKCNLLKIRNKMMPTIYWLNILYRFYEVQGKLIQHLM